VSQNVEGTIHLDGLLEGRLPLTADVRRHMGEWKDFAQTHKLTFNLQFEGDAFSILADSAPRPVRELGDAPSETIRQVLDQFINLFPPDDRRKLISTIRSVEYRPGVEVQTLYVVAPSGAIEPRERTISVDTVAPPEPLPLRRKLLIAGVACLAALLVLAVTSFFVNYRLLFNAFVQGIVPLDLDKLVVEAPAFQTDFDVVDKKFADGRKILVLELKRTDTFPLDDAAVQKLLGVPDLPLSRRLALEALARGYVRCEFYDTDGKFLGFGFQRISALRTESTLSLHLALPPSGRPARIVITY